MKKSLVLLLALWGMMAVGADLCRLAQSGHFRNFSTYGNAAAKVLEKEGKNALEVTLGGINDQVSGAVFFKRPKELTIAPELNTLSITYKGDGSVGNFVVVVQDIDNNSFCWNGKRWQAQTQLPCYDEDWVKRVLKVSEFV